MAAVLTATSRESLEKAKTLPIAEARIGLAKTQPLAAVEPPPAGPRRVRPVAALPTRPLAQPETPFARPAAPITKPMASVIGKPAAAPIAKPSVAPIAKPAAAPTLQVSAPAIRQQMTLPSSSVDDGWVQGRKRNRPSEPIKPLKVAEGTQPSLPKVKLPDAKPAGKQATALSGAPAPRAVPAERPSFARGSQPPPMSGKPLPSLFSVIDRKKPEPQAAGPSRLPGLPPPPPPARPTIGPKKTVSSVVAAASLGAAPMAIAATRQTGEHALVPSPAAVLLDDEVEEIEEIEPDLPDFVATGSEVSGMIVLPRPSSSAPLFDPPPRSVSVQATQFSAAEAAFFAAGDELDTLDLEPQEDSFDDLPGVDRPSFWSRLKSRAAAGR